VKKCYFVFLLGFAIIIFFLTLSPFNVYHWINAKNIVKSAHFAADYSKHVDEVKSVKYLGRNAYLLKVAEGKQYIYIIKKSNGVTSSQIFEGGKLIRRDLR
jgi:hypothetical protein